MMGGQKNLHLAQDPLKLEERTQENLLRGEHSTFIQRQKATITKFVHLGVAKERGFDTTKEKSPYWKRKGVKKKKRSEVSSKKVQYSSGRGEEKSGTTSFHQTRPCVMLYKRSIKKKMDRKRWGKEKKEIPEPYLERV